MGVSKLQQDLFEAIRRNIPDHLSATEEIAKVLDVSVDSVYRRMRGEKTISLDELHALCSHYKISLDSVLNRQTGAFIFQGNFLNDKTFRFDAHLSSMVYHLASIKKFKEIEFYWLCKDVPVFHHFQFR